MEVADAIALIKPAFSHKIQSSIWADLGCGTGTFTAALAYLLGDGSKIYAVDRNSQRIKSPTENSSTEIEFVKLNFVDDALPFRNLDGILMANSLHFVKDKSEFIERIKNHLKVDGQMIIVEYERKKPTPWVPYPIGLNNLVETFSACGFSRIEKIGEKDSIYGPEKIYACLIKS
jgi:ubiquinone/menaquinone biosynthesis C-methylase UbiE